MGDFSIGTSLTLVLRTYPFLLLRAAVYFGMAAAFVVAAGGGGAIGLAIGSLAGPPGRVPGLFWGAVGGIAFIAFIVWWLREYFLYLIKAGHVAAMVLALDGKTPLPGLGQAIGLVQQRFREIPVLFLIDRLAGGALGTATELPDEAASPSTTHIPVRLAVGFLREVILARLIRSAARNIWAEARDALILFAQNRHHLMRNAILLAAFGYGISLLVFLAALIPTTAIAATYPGASAPIAVMLAVVFAWSFKQALIEPLLIASMLQVYFKTTTGQEPDLAWDMKLTEATAEFREIKARAVPFARSPRRSFIA